MGKLKQLTEDEASDRLHWLRSGLAANELDRAMLDSIPPHGIDAKVIEKLHEIKRVAAEVANYYLNLEPQVTWEVGEEPAHPGDPIAKLYGES